MAKKLSTYVTAHERDDKGNPTGRSETFGPGDVLPRWAETAITNPGVWDDSEDDDPVRPSDPGNSGAVWLQPAGEVEESADQDSAPAQTKARRASSR